MWRAPLSVVAAALGGGWVQRSGLLEVRRAGQEPHEQTDAISQLSLLVIH